VFYKNEYDQTINEFIGVKAHEKSKSKNPLSIRFRLLIAAIFKKDDVQLKYLNALIKGDLTPESLVGMKIGIKIEPGKVGYTMQKSGSMVAIIDVATGNLIQLVDPETGNKTASFADFKKASVAVATYNATCPDNEILKRAFPRISNYFKIDEVDNDSIVEKLLTPVSLVSSSKKLF
jgi:hypothetical protein